MSLVEREIPFEVPEKDLEIASKLMKQVGITSADIVRITGQTSLRFTKDLHTPEMGIRGFLRGILLERAGFDNEKWSEKRKISNLPSVWVEVRNASNEQLSTGEPNNVAESKLIIELAGERNFYNYDWQYLIMWNLGDFTKLTSKAEKEGYLVLPEAGVVLFTDELQALKSGEPLITLHASGFARFGWLNEDKDVYKVIDNNLVLVNASLSD